MNSKIKKIMLLTTGLAGGLLATSIAGITLSSCTFQVQQDPNNNNNNNNQGNGNSTNQGTTTTNPKEELTYNPNANYYTTQIIFDAHGNITNASANTLTISDTGLIFADPAMTTLIGIMPSVQTSQITIPASVKAITGYQAAVVYDTTSGKIVNPDFNPGTGLVIGATQAILDLGSVGAFQHVGAITDGNNNSGVTPPTMAPANGLSTLTTLNFANNSQLQTIGPKAFLGCSNLTTVNLPDSTNTIGTQAFQNCTNLQTINLKGVQYIGDAAFNNAFIAQNSALATANPVSLDLTGAQFIGIGAFDSSVWTSSTTRATGPVQVLPGTVGDTGTTITETQNLSKISSISFAKPLTTLSPYAFNGANYLKSVDLSGCTSLASIGNNAFSNTQNLTSAKFSNTIDTIGNSAFSNAPLTETLTFNTATDLTIGDNAFNSQALTTIDFSQVKGNIMIGQSAFSNSNTENTSLTTLNLPTVPTGEDVNKIKIVMIGNNAFSNCASLTLPGLTEANKATYSLPANIGYVGQNAFSTATLDKITGGFNYTPTFTAVTNELANVANGLFVGMANGSAYFGPLTAFNNTNLTSIDLSNTNIEALNYGDLDQSIPTNIKIQSGTFANASNLTSITLPASCNQFGLNYSYYSGAFAKCTSLSNLNFKNFTLNDKDAEGNSIQPGFDQITQDTWVQVANIMNALAYFGQQNITAVAPEGVGTESNPINTDAQINGITYNVNANPVATDGTWYKWVNGKDENTAVSQNPAMILRGLAEWAAPRSNFNYPINAYPAGSYGYSVAQPEQSAQSKADATDPQVTVEYPAGLGTSVSANFKDSGNQASLSTSVTGTGSLTWNNGNGPLLNGSGSTADANVIFNNGVQPNGSAVAENSTITLSNNSTRPQSVWYTVSASGQDSGSNKITQQLYNPTDAESKNIFAITKEKIPGALNGGAGGVGSSANPQNASTNVYTTAVGGVQSNTAGTPGNAGASGIAVTQPDANGLKTGTDASTISISQNYLPLGITSAVKDAYFNHNGIIWHYHNGFVASDNDGIYIKGYVNAYIGGTIQAQNNGANYLSVDKWTNQIESNTYGANLTNGVYNDGNGLTSVGSLSGLEAGGTKHDVYGIDNANLSSDGQNFVCYPYVSLFGKKVAANNVASTNPYSNSVGPANVTVTLTLVPGSGTQTQNPVK